MGFFGMTALGVFASTSARLQRRGCRLCVQGLSPWQDSPAACGSACNIYCASWLRPRCPPAIWPSPLWPASAAAAGWHWPADVHPRTEARVLAGGTGAPSGSRQVKATLLVQAEVAHPLEVSIRGRTRTATGRGHGQRRR